jgi:hypothetical protein
LFNPFFALLVASLVFLRFAPAPAQGNDTAAGVEAVLLLAAGALIVVAAVGLSRPRLVWRWQNFSLPGRVNNFVDLMSLAEKSVVLVTGRLHHNLYDQDEVVEALDDLPESVRIVVYSEEPLDADSKRFTKELRRRGATLRRIPSARLSHGAIVDGKHCKIEEFGVADDAPNKHVDYYAFDRRRARKAMAEIEAVAEPVRNAGVEAEAA